MVLFCRNMLTVCDVVENFTAVLPGGMLAGITSHSTCSKRVRPDLWGLLESFTWTCGLYAITEAKGRPALGKKANTLNGVPVKQI